MGSGGESRLTILPYLQGLLPDSQDALNAFSREFAGSL